MSSTRPPTKRPTASEITDDQLDVLYAELAAAAHALKEISKACLVVKPTLDHPYRDDPRWTPWTRFVDRPAKVAFGLGVDLARRYGVGDTGLMAARTAPTTETPI